MDTQIRVNHRRSGVFAHPAATEVMTAAHTAQMRTPPGPDANHR
jgi:hypothetical protein